MLANFEQTFSSRFVVNGQTHTHKKCSKIVNPHFFFSLQVTLIAFHIMQLIKNRFSLCARARKRFKERKKRGNGHHD